MSESDAPQTNESFVGRWHCATWITIIILVSGCHFAHFRSSYREIRAGCCLNFAGGRVRGRPSDVVPSGTGNRLTSMTSSMGFCWLINGTVSSWCWSVGDMLSARGINEVVKVNKVEIFVGLFVYVSLLMYLVHYAKYDGEMSNLNWQVVHKALCFLKFKLNVASLFT